MTFPLRLLSFVSSCALLVGCGPTDQSAPSKNADEAAAGLTPVIMQTDWFPQAEHGGFYQALARGFYREAGLDVDVRPGGPSSHVRLRVARGDADFGLLRSDDTAMAISQGLPLVMVAASLQHDGEALLVHADSPVQDFSDLDGQTVMAPLSMVWVSYIQKKYDVVFKLVPTTYGLASFFADPALVRSCYLTSEPFLAQERGVPVRALPLIDAEYDAYAGVVVRRELVRSSPELVRAFVAATLRGWEDYLNGDPSPADTLILERNPQMSQGQLDYSRAALIEHSMVAGFPEKGERIGAIDMGRLQHEIDRLREFDALAKALSAEDIATLEFLPAAK
ncbi:ABC transporter substrate-binding protein [Cephaloticoccus capnophilus]|nr:ABC transporter substrate-binding protein [Cephaloticoccus capnophilus]